VDIADMHRGFARVSRTLYRLALAICLVLFATRAVAIENSIKAAFLYKFASYATWPETAFAGPEAPITIAVMGADVIAANLEDMVAGRTAQGRAIAVRRLAPGAPADGVHILFIGGAEADQLIRTAGAIRTRPVLVVTDFAGALARGSMINFVVSEQRLRFEVALAAAERSGLKLSSRLLAVALSVRTGEP
jgi:hypothetical protein